MLQKNVRLYKWNIVLYNSRFPFPYPKMTPNFPQQWLKLRQFQNKTYKGIAEGKVRIPVNPVSDGNDPISVNYHNLSLYIYTFFISRDQLTLYASRLCWLAYNHRAVNCGTHCLYAFDLKRKCLSVWDLFRFMLATNIRRISKMTKSFKNFMF